jgi:ABC-type polysaccharide/polyol phosphate export permease
VPAWSVVAGKLLAGIVAALISGVVILGLLITFGVRPQSWGVLIPTMLVLLLVFVSIGLAVGATLKSTRAVVPVAVALGLPLFFVSGAFGPISWTTPVSAAIARIFPVAYANAAIQNATYGYFPLDSSVVTTILILAAWAVAGLALAAITYRRASVVH